MADPVENLRIVIDVIADAEEELNQLAADLLEVGEIADTVDPIRISVNVRGEHELTSLQAQLASLQAMDLSGVGNVDVGGGLGGRGGGGAALGGAGGGGMAVDDLLATQVAQMGRMIRDIDTDFSELSDSMGRTMSAADKAADSFNIADLSMADLHNVMAQLVPTLLVFVGALPAVIGGLVALGAAAFAAASALAAIGGFGLLGAAMARGNGDAMSGMSDIMSEIQSDFMDAFSGLAQRLAPLFEDFMDGLDMFFQQIANMQDVLMGLTDEARAFGAFMSEWMTGLIRDLGLMAEAFAPVFGMIADFAEDMDLLETLTMFFADVLPDLMILNRLLLGMVERLAGMSKGFLEVANAVGLVIQGIFGLFSVIGLSNKEVGILIGTLLVSVTAVNLLSSAMVRALIPALLQAGSYMLGMAGAVLSSNTTLLSYISTVIGASSVTSLFSLSLYQVLGALIAVTGGVYALVSIVGILSSQFADIGSNVDEATKSLRDFRKEQNKVQSNRNPYRDPDLQRGEGVGSSRFAGQGSGGISVRVEGDADEETVRNQTQNAMYRMERPTRGR